MARTVNNFTYISRTLKKYAFYFLITMLWAILAVKPSSSVTHDLPPVGAWVTVFTSGEVFYSKANADKMIKTCKEAGIDHIYLQIYRAGKAYYDSSLTDRSEYEKMAARTGADPIKYILFQAKNNNLKVHAWINILSLAQNEKAPILQKYGQKILSVDQYGRTPLIVKKDELDKYYIRENQLFLEPGDVRVRNYAVSIVEEVVKKYPSFSGVHLDYIRYPSSVPFVPGSRFDTHGISYGYGAVNAENFKKSTGLDINTMDPSRENHQKWDNWRRSQVTKLVKRISDKVRKIAPEMTVSCAVMPTIERSYLVNFQDWTKWLKMGLVDHVVTMNYTDDARLMELNSRSVLFPQFRDSIYIGVGAYLMENSLEAITEQLDFLFELGPGGIVIFSYDDLAKSTGLRKYLSGVQKTN